MDRQLIREEPAAGGLLALLAGQYGRLANPNIVKEGGRGNQTKKFTFDI